MAPTLLRIPIQWFEHTFRAGSSIRIAVEAPAVGTGRWSFNYHRTPMINAILHDSYHRSRWVFGAMPHELARVALPTCGSLLHEPCRLNRDPVPRSDVAPTTE
jgi:hypothetical protein